MTPDTEEQRGGKRESDDGKLTEPGQIVKR